jgi:hypothetical protein
VPRSRDGVENLSERGIRTAHDSLEKGGSTHVAIQQLSDIRRILGDFSTLLRNETPGKYALRDVVRQSIAINRIRFERHHIVLEGPFTRLSPVEAGMALNYSWTDVELAIAVEAYLYLSRLEHAGAAYSEREMTAFLLDGPLKNRNDASIRYRMRDISSVLARRGWSTLRPYSPARQVGSGVRVRIEAILDTHPSAAIDPPIPILDGDLATLLPIHPRSTTLKLPVGTVRRTSSSAARRGVMR